MIKFMAICILLVASGPTVACSTTLDVPLFQPSGKATAGLDFAHLPKIPPLKARVLKIVRANPKLMCDHLAEFDVEVSWAEPTNLSLEEHGLYFRPAPPLAVFSSMWDVPIQGKPSGSSVVVKIYVHDEAVEHHQAIDVNVELFAVNHVSQLGQVSSFVLHADSD